MKDKDHLRLEQVDQALERFRALEAQPPRRGWVRAIQNALGMSNRQLANRLHLKPQTIEDMQEGEASGTIKLQTLQKLAGAMNCHLVYAVVPNKPLAEIRKDQALRVALPQLKRVAHSMNLEAQGISEAEQKLELDRLVQKLLTGNPRKLWD